MQKHRIRRSNRLFAIHSYESQINDSNNGINTDAITKHYNINKRHAFQNFNNNKSKKTYPTHALSKNIQVMQL